MSQDRARRDLVRCLQLAYSGELGAIWAYLGHRKSLPHGDDRAGIRRLLVDEVRHRRSILNMLRELGARPDRRRERKMRFVGGSIALFCRVGGWFPPMYGAARLERNNIVEYEIAARIAWHAGRHDLIDTLLHYAEVEWDHESWLRDRASSHRLWRLVPHWPAPPARTAVRASFEAFRAHPCPVRRGSSPFVR